MGELVMRSYYVDSDVERRLDEHAWRNRASKADYLRKALAFSVALIEQLGPDATPEAFQAELGRRLSPEAPSKERPQEPATKQHGAPPRKARNADSELPARQIEIGARRNLVGKAALTQKLAHGLATKKRTPTPARKSGGAAVAKVKKGR